MTISILIPTHDYACYQLVSELHTQAERIGVSYEIILAEDGSRDSVSMIANLKVKELSNCRYIRLKDNMGRAAIRNFLIRESKGNMLLFLDSDGKIISTNFLRDYLEAGKSHPVVCGGIKHPDVCLDPNRQLRWRYEKCYESRHGMVSGQFRSFSFLISRKVAELISFDERYNNYGYEDVKFGDDMRAHGYEVFAIDNPVLNKDIEESDVFLRKTEIAVTNAYKFRDELRESVTLIRFHEKYKVIMPVVRIVFKSTRSLMRKNLTGSNPSLFLFSFYKLGYYSTLA